MKREFDLKGVQPAHGEIAEVASGLFWARLPIPYPPMEVNIYIVESAGGWTLIDTGMSADMTREAWDLLLQGALKGFKFGRIISTHHHPDHIGLADWLSERLEADVWTTAGALSAFKRDTNIYGPEAEAAIERFCMAHGLNEDAQYALKRQPNSFLSRVEVDVSRLKLLSLDKPVTLGIGTFDLMTADGHAAGQLIMRDRAGQYFFSADQILPGVVSKLAFDPLDSGADTAGAYVSSLEDIEAWVEESALILPGHFPPFRGLSARIAEIRERQIRRGARLMGAFGAEPLQVGQVLGVLSGREPQGKEIAFALAETFANINNLVSQGRLVWQGDGARMMLAPA
ncbi:MAG: MBL fold metallo-hydrolase [Rhodobiaceae bacterium]|nr:MBL fold metallo-hydrolase [Rhodobiaceae bacterium]MCC0057322.1 MBL fold metallo-hydrolase [Rhodobiaceae bacterium]